MTLVSGLHTCTAGQLLQVQRAYGTSLQQNYVTHTYGPNGTRQTVKDANNNLSTFEYDGFDRLAKLRFPVATKGANQSSPSDYEQYGYDNVGNRTSLRKRDGRTIGFSYDALNGVRVRTVPTSGGGSWTPIDMCGGIRCQVCIFA